MEMLQGVGKQHLRPRAVVGNGLKIFLPSPPNYVTRSPGCRIKRWYSYCAIRSIVRILSVSIAHPKCQFLSRWTSKCLITNKFKFFSLFLELPDIVPDTEVLQRDMKINSIPLQYLRCPLEENCLSETADYEIRYMIMLRQSQHYPYSSLS